MKQLGLLFVLLVLCGCASRVIDWAKDTVQQGAALPDFSKPAKVFLRSFAIYDQFETRAIFDVLWLADPVRIAYARLFAAKNGLRDAQEQLFESKQLAQNEALISFYILSLYNIPLRQDEGDWSLLLEIDGLRSSPREIKQIELSPEYVSFFGKNYSRFKVPYVVTFAARDECNKRLITDNTKSIALLFRSMNKEARVVWDLSSIQKIPAKHSLGCCVKP